MDRFLARPANTLPLPKSLKRIENRIVVPYCAELPVRESVRERSNSTEEFVEVSSCGRDGIFMQVHAHGFPRSKLTEQLQTLH